LYGFEVDSGKNDIVLGNIIGSNIFNILIVLGTAATIKPISINFVNPINTYTSLWIECAVMFAINIFAYIVMYKRRKISRFTGVILLLLYIIYMTKQIYFMV
jgi:cation:H+ antiporter